VSIFQEGNGMPPSAIRRDPGSVLRRPVTIDVDPIGLPGDLTVPPEPLGTVLFAHGSGSSRRSPRNVQVAVRLNDAGIGTLLFDLLTPTEAEDRVNVFDIDLLADRLIAAATWLRGWPRVGPMPLGFFGASTGAAAALVGAARLGRDVAAVVSRGGRPDLAGDALERVVAPTLLIVGGADVEVLRSNRWAKERMHAETTLEVIAGATHLFEEPGALEVVAELASGWFATHLAPAAARGPRSPGTPPG
jgi:putative phosphoribosyl transferase